ncbi:MAG: ABC transporter ATP-binding protein, partial [Clostridia bacterium]|nr:ABC transporter ATP-binding protein [Clostridia bacterium]
MSDKKNEKLSASRITQNVFWVLRRYLKYAPIATLVWALGIIFNRASWSCCSVIFSKILFDAIAAGEGFRRVVIAVLLFALIDSVATLWWHGARVCFNIGECKVLKKVERELYEKAISMDLACFEDPEFYNDYMMALDSTNEKMRATIYAFLDTVGNGFSLLGCIAIIGTISPVYVILPIVGGILGYFITLRDNRVNFEYLKGRKPAERRRDYYGRVFYLPEYAKEVRLSGATKLLLRRFSETMADLRKYDRGYALRQATLQFLKDFVVYDFIASIVMMGICIYQVLISKTVAVGGAAALVNAVEQTTYAVGHFSRNFASFQDNAQYIECMRKFLDYEPKIVGGTLPAPEGPAEIRAEGLTFAYPGSDKAVLDGIDLTIAPGERVALVGYNGAGKTTLIKLLLRLYDPTEGRILLNGHDLREYDITSLREYFGCVFQDFVLFAATLGENVA